MRNNVGKQIQDTSIGSLVDSWLNDAYQDISRRHMWVDLIDDDYTLTLTAGTAEYSLPSDFKEELFVANITQGFSLRRYTPGQRWQERARDYQDGSINNGTSFHYDILLESSKIRFDPPPDAADTIAMPYRKSVTDLSADSSTTSIRDIERAMEFYAVAQGWAYKRQLQKSDWYLQRYEYEVNKRIGQEKSRPNQRYQRIPQGYRHNLVRRFTGDVSYDSI